MTTFPIVDDKHYHSRRASSFAAYALEREQSQERFIAGRQAAHDLAASARAAAKRERVRLEIARRPRGQTEVLGHREDGRPIHRYVCAVRPRPYTSPEHRAAPKSYPSDAVGVAAALKAESPHLAPGKDPAGRQELRPLQRAMRKARMARKRRRGWA